MKINERFDTCGFLVWNSPFLQCSISHGKNLVLPYFEGWKSCFSQKYQSEYLVLCHGSQTGYKIHFMLTVKCSYFIASNIHPHQHTSLLKSIKHLLLYTKLVIRSTVHKTVNSVEESHHKGSLSPWQCFISNSLYLWYPFVWIRGSGLPCSDCVWSV